MTTSCMHACSCSGPSSMAGGYLTRACVPCLIACSCARRPPTSDICANRAVGAMRDEWSFPLRSRGARAVSCGREAAKSPSPSAHRIIAAMLSSRKSLPPFALHFAPRSPSPSLSSPPPTPPPQLDTSPPTGQSKQQAFDAMPTHTHHPQPIVIPPPAPPNVFPPTPVEGLGIDGLFPPDYSPVSPREDSFRRAVAADGARRGSSPTSPFNFQPTAASKSPITPKPVRRYPFYSGVDPDWSRTSVADTDINTRACRTRSFWSRPHAHPSLYPPPCLCQRGRNSCAR